MIKTHTQIRKVLPLSRATCTPARLSTLQDFLHPLYNINILTYLSNILYRTMYSNSIVKLVIPLRIITLLTQTQNKFYFTYYFNQTDNYVFTCTPVYSEMELKLCHDNISYRYIKPYIQQLRIYIFGIDNFLGFLYIHIFTKN